MSISASIPVNTAVRDAFVAIAAGIEPTAEHGRRIAMLVVTDDFSLGRGDPYVAAGLGRELARLGYGVRLVPKERWYTDDYAEDELLVAFLPSIDLRRIPAGLPVMAWIRNCAEEWHALPALEDYDAILTSSELSRDFIAERFRGPMGVVPIGFDEELFVPPASAPGRPASRERVAVSSVNHWGSDRAVHVAMRGLDARTRLDWYGVDKSASPLVSRFNRGSVDYFSLASVYGESVLTIDDVHAVAVGWGNHNSRLFEALACGSLVVTNTSLGLRDLGLEQVPVYRTPDELVRLIERGGTGEFTELAAELSTVVRERHSFRVRAAAFAEFVESHDLWQAPRRPSAVINFFPDYTVANPFQRMLYAELPDGVRAVETISRRGDFTFRDDGGDLSGQVLHVHWQNVVLQPSRNHAEAERVLEQITSRITELTARGMKLVWTVHNTLPHEFKYYFHEIELCRFLARTADVVHLLSAETLDTVRDLFELDADKCVVVEHGSYLDVYPELLDRATARQRLGLLSSERVVLFFGTVRPYKGLEGLVEAFRRIHDDDPGARLLVAGLPGRTVDAEFLERLQKLPFATTRLGFVPDSDVHLYFRAADVQVAPYGQVLNSGSVLLGLSYGLPVVAPRLGALRSLADEPFMFSYADREVGGLENALRRALGRIGDTAITDAATKRARSWTGEDMSRAFVRDVLGRVVTL